MKILYIITGLDYGGAERLLLDASAQLKKMGHDVNIIYLKSQGLMLDDKTNKEFNIKKVDIEKNKFIDSIKGLMKEIKEFNPDVVHTHLAHADLYGRIAAKLCGVKAIFSTLHNTDTWRKSPTLYYKVYNRLDRFMLNGIKDSQCIAISDAVKDYHVANCKFDPKKISVIKNAVDVELIREKGQEELEEQYKHINGEFLLVNVGRLVEQKGQIYLLQAMNELINKRGIADIRCMIVGEGPERETLEKYIKDNKLEEKVKLLGLQTNPYKYIKNGDVFVMPSRYEGFGIVVLEAYALDKPVIGSKVDGLEEIVLDEITGRLVEPENYLDLADKIQGVYKERELLDKYKENCGKILEEYTIEGYAKKLLKAYKKDEA